MQDPIKTESVTMPDGRVVKVVTEQHDNARVVQKKNPAVKTEPKPVQTKQVTMPDGSTVKVVLPSSVQNIPSERQSSQGEYKTSAPATPPPKTEIPPIQNRQDYYKVLMMAASPEKDKAIRDYYRKTGELKEYAANKQNFGGLYNADKSAVVEEIDEDKVVRNLGSNDYSDAYIFGKSDKITNDFLIKSAKQQTNRDFYLGMNKNKFHVQKDGTAKVLADYFVGNNLNPEDPYDLLGINSTRSSGAADKEKLMNAGHLADNRIRSEVLSKAIEAKTAYVMKADYVAKELGLYETFDNFKSKKAMADKNIGLITQKLDMMAQAFEKKTGVNPLTTDPEELYKKVGEKNYKDFLKEYKKLEAEELQIRNAFNEAMNASPMEKRKLNAFMALDEEKRNLQESFGELLKTDAKVNDREKLQSYIDLFAKNDIKPVKVDAKHESEIDYKEGYMAVMMAVNEGLAKDPAEAYKFITENKAYIFPSQRSMIGSEIGNSITDFLHSATKFLWDIHAKAYETVGLGDETGRIKNQTLFDRWVDLNVTIPTTSIQPITDGKMHWDILPSKLARTMADMAILLGTGGGVGGMLKTAGMAPKMAGAAGLTTAGTLQSYQGYRDLAKQMDLSDDQAILFSTVASLAQGALENISPNTIIANTLTGKLQTKLLSKEFWDVVKRNPKMMKDEIVKVAKSTGKEIGEENLQEISQTYSDQLIAQITNGVFGLHGMNKLETDVKREEIYNTVLLTTLTTGLFHTGSLAVESTKEKAKKEVLMLQAAEKYGDVLTEAKGQIGKTISAEDYDRFEKELTEYKSGMDFITNDQKSGGLNLPKSFVPALIDDVMTLQRFQNNRNEALASDQFGNKPSTTQAKTINNYWNTKIKIAEEVLADKLHDLTKIFSSKTEETQEKLVKNSAAIVAEGNKEKESKKKKEKTVKPKETPAVTPEADIKEQISKDPDIKDLETSFNMLSVEQANLMNEIRDDDARGYKKDRALKENKLIEIKKEKERLDKLIKEKTEVLKGEMEENRPEPTEAEKKPSRLKKEPKEKPLKKEKVVKEKKVPVEKTPVVEKTKPEKPVKKTVASVKAEKEVAREKVLKELDERVESFRSELPETMELAIPDKHIDENWQKKAEAKNLKFKEKMDRGRSISQNERLSITPEMRAAVSTFKNTRIVTESEAKEALESNDPYKIAELINKGTKRIEYLSTSKKLTQKQVKEIGRIQAQVFVAQADAKAASALRGEMKKEAMQKELAKQKESLSQKTNKIAKENHERRIRAYEMALEANEEFEKAEAKKKKRKEKVDRVFNAAEKPLNKIIKNKGKNNLPVDVGFILATKGTALAMKIVLRGLRLVTHGVVSAAQLVSNAKQYITDNYKQINEEVRQEDPEIDIPTIQDLYDAVDQFIGGIQLRKDGKGLKKVFDKMNAELQKTIDASEGITAKDKKLDSARSAYRPIFKMMEDVGVKEAERKFYELSHKFSRSVFKNEMTFSEFLEDMFNMEEDYVLMRTILAQIGYKRTMDMFDTYSDMTLQRAFGLMYTGENNIALLNMNIEGRYEEFRKIFYRTIQLPKDGVPPMVRIANIYKEYIALPKATSFNESFERSLGFLQDVTGIEAETWKHFFNSPKQLEYYVKDESGKTSLRNFSNIEELLEYTEEGNRLYTKNGAIVSQPHFMKWLADRISPIINSKEIEKESGQTKLYKELERFFNKSKDNNQPNLVQLSNMLTSDEHIAFSFSNINSDRESSAELNSTLNTRADRILEADPKESKFVEFYHENGIPEVRISYLSGSTRKSDSKNREAEQLSDNDVITAMLYMYANGPVNSYESWLGQFGDKGKHYFATVPRYENGKEVYEQLYKDKKDKMMLPPSEFKNHFKEIKEVILLAIEENTSALKSKMGDNLEAAVDNFLYNYLINSYETSVYFHGKSSSFTDITDFGKRTNNTSSTGYTPNIYFEDGVGKTHRHLMINDNILDKLIDATGKVIGKRIKRPDGITLWSKKYAEKFAKSLPEHMAKEGRFEFNTSKAQFSYISPTGHNILIKSNIVVVDDLADFEFEKVGEKSVYWQIKKLMNDANIDWVSFASSVKTQGNTIFNFFENNEPIVIDKNSLKKVEKAVQVLPNDSIYVQQDLRHDVSTKWKAEPTQITGNIMALGSSTLIESRKKAIKEIGLKSANAESEAYQGKAKDKWIASNIEEETIARYLLDSGVPANSPLLKQFTMTVEAQRYNSRVMDTSVKRSTGIVIPDITGTLKAPEIKTATVKTGYDVKKNKVIPRTKVVTFVKLGECYANIPGARYERSFDSIQAAMEFASYYPDMIDQKTGELKTYLIEEVDDKFIVPGEPIQPSRVPSSNLNCNGVMRLKAPLPSSMGNMIMSNIVNQVVAGEDADGDVRYITSLVKDKNGNQLIHGSFVNNESRLQSILNKQILQLNKRVIIENAFAKAFGGNFSNLMKNEKLMQEAELYFDDVKLEIDPQIDSDEDIHKKLDFTEEWVSNGLSDLLEEVDGSTRLETEFAVNIDDNFKIMRSVNIPAKDHVLPGQESIETTNNVNLLTLVEEYENPDNYSMIYNPITENYWDDYFEEKKKKKEGYRNSLKTMLELRKNATMGNKTIGIAANLSTTFDFAKKFNLNYTGTPFQFEVNGTTYSVDKTVTDKYGIVKHLWESFLNFSLNNIKDMRLQYTGINDVTANMFGFLFFNNKKLEDKILSEIAEKKLNDTQAAKLYLQEYVEYAKNLFELFTGPLMQEYVEAVNSTKRMRQRYSPSLVFRIMTELWDDEDFTSFLKRKDKVLTEITGNPKDRMSQIVALRMLQNISNQYTKLTDLIKLSREIPGNITELLRAKELYEKATSNTLYGFDLSGLFPKGVAQDVVWSIKHGIEAASKLMADEPVNTIVGRDIYNSLNEDVRSYESDRLIRGIQTIFYQQALNHGMTKEDAANRLNEAFVKYKDNGFMQLLETKQDNRGLKFVLADGFIAKGLSREAIKNAWSEFDKLPDDVKKAFVAYAAYQFGNYSLSTRNGNFTSLFSPETHQQIARDIQKFLPKWNQFTNVDPFVRLIFANMKNFNETPIVTNPIQDRTVFEKSEKFKQISPEFQGKLIFVPPGHGKLEFVNEGGKTSDVVDADDIIMDMLKERNIRFDQTNFGQKAKELDDQHKNDPKKREDFSAAVIQRIREEVAAGNTVLFSNPSLLKRSKDALVPDYSVFDRNIAHFQENLEKEVEMGRKMPADVLKAFNNYQDMVKVTKVINKTGTLKEALQSSASNIEAISRINFIADENTGYKGRTEKNASADATIAIATDFSTAGEVLTKSSVESQKRLYVPISANNLEVTPERVEKIVQKLNTANVKSPNIAGNGLYTLKGKYTQAQIDEFTYKLIKAINESPNLKQKITSIRTGGQTGFDEAGAKAGLKLGIPTMIYAPADWKYRVPDKSKKGYKDITDETKFKQRFEQKVSEKTEVTEVAPKTLQTIQNNALLQAVKNHTLEMLKAMPVSEKTAEFEKRIKEATSTKELAEIQKEICL